MSYEAFFFYLGTIALVIVTVVFGIALAYAVLILRRILRIVRYTEERIGALAAMMNAFQNASFVAWLLRIIKGRRH